MALDLNKYKKTVAPTSTPVASLDLNKYKKQPAAPIVAPQTAGTQIFGAQKPVGTTIADPRETLEDIKQTGGNIWDTLKKSGSKFKEIFTAGRNREQTALETGAQLAGQTLGTGFGVATDIVKGAVKTALPQSTETYLKEKAGEIIKPIAESEPVKTATDFYSDLSPRAKRNIGAAAEIVSTLPIGFAPRAVKGSLKTAENLLETAVKKTAPLLTKTEPAIERKIISSFEKGVKPLLPARSTSATTAKYKESIVDAVKTIKENKINLAYTDDIGEQVVGRTPQTLQEMSTAIEQTKKTIYDQYDSLAKEAGEQGLKINTNSLTPELDNIIANEALQISNPEAIIYAQNLKDRLSYRELDAQTVQSVIQNYNKSLEAFYRNPTYDSASKASIDALIANRLRQALDDGISGLTGAQYQSLKNQYGSLKTIERDVIKAALRDARKNNKGLIDYTDILTGGDVISGILTLNPTLLARGAGARSIKEFYKYLNSPNRAIKNMFKEAEKINPRLPYNTPKKNTSIETTNNAAVVNTTPRNVNTTGLSDTNKPIVNNNATNPINNNNNITIKNTISNSDKNVQLPNGDGLTFNYEVANGENRLIIDLFPTEAIKGQGITKQRTIEAFQQAKKDGHTIIEPSNGLWTKEGSGFMKSLEKDGYVKQIENRGGIERYKIVSKTNLPKNDITTKLTSGINLKGVELEVKPLTSTVLELNWIKAPKQASQILKKLEANAKKEGFKTIQGTIKRDGSASKLKEVWSNYGFKVYDDPNSTSIIIEKALK
jgi:hypothetical protein